MRASELIKVLADSIYKHGDCKVKQFDGSDINSIKHAFIEGKYCEFVLSRSYKTDNSGMPGEYPDKEDDGFEHKNLAIWEENLQTRCKELTEKGWTRIRTDWSEVCGCYLVEFKRPKQ